MLTIPASTLHKTIVVGGRKVRIQTYSAQILDKLMEEKGWDQNALAKASGLSQASISKYIRDESSPSMKNAVRLGKALGVLFVADWTSEPETEKGPSK